MIATNEDLGRGTAVPLPRCVALFNDIGIIPWRYIEQVQDASKRKSLYSTEVHLYQMSPKTFCGNFRYLTTQ